MRKNKGQALIVAYMVVSVFITMAAALSSKAVSEKNISLRDKLNTEAFYLAEGGIEDAVSKFTSAIANYQSQPDVQNYNVVTTFNTFSGASVSSSIRSLESTDRLVLEGQTNVLVRNYEITSTAVHPQNNAISVTLHQIIARRLIPTFQHSVFYNEDLEVLPGADMTLSGRIHCNKDIYMDAESGKTLKINSFSLRSSGNIYNMRKDDGRRLAGEVSIRVNKTGSAKYENMNNLDSDSADWTAEATDLWKGTVQSAVHGVTGLSVPAVASIQPGGYYASQANVLITNGQITKDGRVLKEGVDYPVGTITTTETFYSNREGKYITMTNVNLRKLANLDNEKPAPGSPAYPNNLPSNGLIYATRDEYPADTGEPGIRLKNAAEIGRDKGLTVVSNDPVYIQGNFNTGVDSGVEKPVSVICDSLNLLSNNWNDANSLPGSWNLRTSTETTFNCAFIAGIDQTGTGHYNGGLENYPRLHENWSGVQLNIKGSFVALWNNAVAQGSWLYGQPQYTAPKRNWSYNSAFNNVSNLPPFTPWAVEARRIAWWKE
jgi:hypothetical protein